MSQSERDGPRKYHLNFSAADELEKQAQRAKSILERLAAHLAATEPRRSGPLKDLVEKEHVRRAADLLFGVKPKAAESAAGHCVFISYSHDDSAFIKDLGEKLTQAGLTYFISDRDIAPASDWSERIWEAIRGCRVFLSVLTPRFLASRWRDLEGGAALAAGKPVLTVLRYVERRQLESPFDRFQSKTVENNQQLEELVESLRRLSEGDGRGVGEGETSAES